MGLAQLGAVLLFVGLTCWPLVGAAQSAPEERRARFEQILGLMNKNTDRMIDQAEVTEFLKQKVGSSIEAIKAKLAKVGLVIAQQDSDVLQKIVERQAELLINGPGRGQGITQARLGAFEDADLEYPFTGKMKDLLPPPPAAAVVAPPVQDTGGDRPPPTPLLNQVQEWISVRKSFLVGKDVGQPASLSLTHFADADETREAGRPHTVFDIRGALMVKLHEGEWDVGAWTLQLRPTAVIEADISTDSKVGRNKIIHRLGAEGVLFETRPSQPWTGHNFVATFDYTTDREYRSAVIGGTAQYSPNILPIGIGRAFEIGPFQFGWRPYLGLTGGSVQDDGGNKKLKDVRSFVDAYGRVAADLLIGTRFHLSPEYTVFKELRNKQSTHALFSLGARYVLDDKGRFSITSTYTKGEESPDFVDQDQLTFGLGIKF